MRNKGHSRIAAILDRIALRGARCFLAGGAVLVFIVTAASLHADQVEMQNGDRYVGKVVSLNANTLVVQNDVLGVVRIPREKVSLIMLGTTPAAPQAGAATAKSPVTAHVAPPAAPVSNAGNPFRELAAHTNLIQKIQSQFLSDAGPEANKKFEETLNGLMTGQLNMDDLRAQAQAAANQLRTAKQEGGGDLGISADAYLAILDQFLKSTPATSGSKTNPARATQKAKPAPAEPEN